MFEISIFVVGCLYLAAPAIMIFNLIQNNG